MEIWKSLLFNNSVIPCLTSHRCVVSTVAVRVLIVRTEIAAVQLQPSGTVCLAGQTGRLRPTATGCREEEEERVNSAKRRWKGKVRWRRFHALSRAIPPSEKFIVSWTRQLTQSINIRHASSRSFNILKKFNCRQNALERAVPFSFLAPLAGNAVYSH